MNSYFAPLGSVNVPNRLRAPPVLFFLGPHTENVTWKGKIGSAWSGPCLSPYPDSHDNFS